MVAILEGSLDTSTAAETEKAMNPLNDVEGKDVIIDFTDLTYISSAGLRIFLGIQYARHEQDGDSPQKNKIRAQFREKQHTEHHEHRRNGYPGMKIKAPKDK